MAYGQFEENVSGTLIGTNLDAGDILHITDSKNSQLSTGNFTSVDPAVYIHLGLVDDSATPAVQAVIYSCAVTFRITPYNTAGTALTTYDIVLEVKHDYVTEGINGLVDLAVYRIPGIHKANVVVHAIQYKNASGTNIPEVSGTAVYAKTSFSCDRYYNLKNTTACFLVLILVTVWRLRNVPSK